VTAISDVVANISAISRASNTVTVTTSTPHGLVPSDQVTVAGVTDTSFNGVFAVATLPDSTHFTYSQTAANASSSGGTAAPVGSIAAGVHQCAVIFVTRQGYLTRPSPPVSWTANGGRRANVTGIPSPFTLSNIMARILAFTGAGGATFFYTTGLNGAPQMQIFDNSALSYVVDFSDTALLAGISADTLFQLVELGECAGVIGYARSDHAIRRGRLQRRAAATIGHHVFGARAGAHDGHAHAGYAACQFVQRAVGSFDHGHFRAGRAGLNFRVGGIHRTHHAGRQLPDDSFRPAAPRLCRRNSHEWRGLSG
jgi:hypothetical protein